MSQNLVRYSFKVWMTSVLIAPLFSVTVFWLQADSGYNILLNMPDFLANLMVIYIGWVIVGAAASFCTWVIFLFVIRLTTLFHLSIRDHKLIIAASGVLLTLATFMLILPAPILTSDEFYIPLCYSACIAFGSGFHRLELDNTKAGEAVANG